ncbi:MAG: hypothetical protein JNM00_15160 [Flavobacteriales bacterium]|nr:hypothetical protein [Flavobacteriales bacterium]
MKHYTLILGFLFFAFLSHATVRNVNNASPSPGQYSTIASAIAASLPGDTLYLAGTGLDYGTVNLDKQLTIIGPGWKVNGAIYGGNAQVGTINMTNIAAAGSRFVGFRFFQLNSSTASANVFTGLIVQRCIIDDCLYLGNDDWSGTLVEGNLFTSSGPNFFAPVNSANVTSSTVRNNIFNGILYYATSNLIEQNIFLATANANVAIVTQGTLNTFRNNICIGRNCMSVDNTATVTANMSYQCTTPNFNGTGNYPGIDPEFSSYTPGLYNWSYDYHLKASSPAVGAGFGGLDLGVYAGDGIYRKDGEPNIPIVSTFTIADGAVVPANANITINVTGTVHE